MLRNSSLSLSVIFFDMNDITICNIAQRFFVLFNIKKEIAIIEPSLFVRLCLTKLPIHSKLPIRQITAFCPSYRSINVSKLPTRQITKLILHVIKFPVSKLPTRQITALYTSSSVFCFSKLPTRQITVANILHLLCISSA